MSIQSTECTSLLQWLPRHIRRLHNLTNCTPDVDNTIVYRNSWGLNALLMGLSCLTVTCESFILSIFTHYLQIQTFLLCPHLSLWKSSWKALILALWSTISCASQDWHLLINKGKIMKNQSFQKEHLFKLINFRFSLKIDMLRYRKYKKDDFIC